MNVESVSAAIQAARQIQFKDSVSKASTGMSLTDVELEDAISAIGFERILGEEDDDFELDEEEGLLG